MRLTWAPSLSFESLMLSVQLVVLSRLVWQLPCPRGVTKVPNYKGAHGDYLGS